MISRILQWLRQHWKLVIFIVLAVIVALFFVINKLKKDNTPPQTVQPEYRDLTKTIDFSGRVDAQQLVNMHFASGGLLSYLGAEEGQTVKKGQTVASLDQHSVQKQLQNNLSLYQTQRSEFDQSLSDTKDKTLTTDQQFLAAQNQYALDRSVLSVQIQDLAFTNYRLTAPFAGVLIRSPYNVTGVQVSATDTWELVNPNTLFFRISVDEVDIDQIKVGQQATIKLDAMPDQAINAEVQTIPYQVNDTSTGTVFPVELKFTDPVTIENQRVGMNGEAYLVLAQKTHILTVPIETIVSRDDKSYVNVFADGKKVEREVKTGIETDEYAEIEDGLSESDQVVLP